MCWIQRLERVIRKNVQTHHFCTVWIPAKKGKASKSLKMTRTWTQMSCFRANGALRMTGGFIRWDGEAAGGAARYPRASHMSQSQTSRRTSLSVEPLKPLNSLPVFYSRRRRKIISWDNKQVRPLCLLINTSNQILWKITEHSENDILWKHINLKT